MPVRERAGNPYLTENNMVAEKEFRSAIWGKYIYVLVQGTEFNVQISRKDALSFFEYTRGNIAWNIVEDEWGNGDDIYLEANATELFGITGSMEESR